MFIALTVGDNWVSGFIWTIKQLLHWMVMYWLLSQQHWRTHGETQVAAIQLVHIFTCAAPECSELQGIREAVAAKIRGGHIKQYCWWQTGKIMGSMLTASLQKRIQHENSRKAQYIHINFQNPGEGSVRPCWVIYCSEHCNSYTIYSWALHVFWYVLMIVCFRTESQEYHRYFQTACCGNDFS